MAPPTEPAKCLVKKCDNRAAANCRGLCIRCKGSANRLVESGQATWDILVQRGLALPTDEPLTKQFNQEA